VKRLWLDHSLTIVLSVLGAVVTGVAWALEAGKAFDTLLGLGQGLLTVALFYFAANYLREKAKPED
jgi:hypothetical protein